MGRNTPRTSALASGDALVVLFNARTDIRHVPLIVYQMAWNGLEFRYFLEFDPSGKKTLFWNAGRHDLLNAGDSITKSLGVVCDIWVSVQNPLGPSEPNFMVSVAQFGP